MSGPVRSRHAWRRFATRAISTMVALALFGTLAAALQVHEVRVSGTQRFPARDIETVLRSALGSPTVATRASLLRAGVRALPWVANATIRVSLDGVVTCAVTERQPVAIATDMGVRHLMDQEGRFLGPAPDGTVLLELDGFAPFPEERATLLAAVPDIERAWGAPLVTTKRVGPHDVALHFASTLLTVLADPSQPDGLVAARRVFAAWTATQPVPLRLDARVRGLVAVLPAPQNTEEEE